GQRILSTVDSYGIHNEFIRVVRGGFTDVTGVLVNNEGQPAYVGLKNVLVTNVDSQLVKAAEERIASADAVLVTLEIPIEAAEEAVNIANEHGVKVFLNPAPPREERLPTNLLQKVDVLIPNSWEAAMLLALPTTDLAEMARLLHSLGPAVTC